MFFLETYIHKYILKSSIMVWLKIFFKKKTENIEHDVNFIYEHVIIFEPCLIVADHKLMFELDSAARFISDKKKWLVDSFKS